LSCNEAKRLKAEAERAYDTLVDLFQRKQLVFAHGHENTLRVLDTQINRQFAEKDRAENAVQKHCAKHGCD